MDLNKVIVADLLNPNSELRKGIAKRLTSHVLTDMFSITGNPESIERIALAAANAAFECGLGDMLLLYWEVPNSKEPLTYSTTSKMLLAACDNNTAVEVGTLREKFVVLLSLHHVANPFDINREVSVTELQDLLA